jgi:WD domain, G-beta repeat
MADERLRNLERAWLQSHTRTPEESDRYLRELLRTGAVTQDRLGAAALMGYEPARRAAGHSPPDPPQPLDVEAVIDALQGDRSTCVRTLIGLAWHAPKRWDRFDGLHDGVIHVLDLLEGWVRDPDGAGRAAAEAALERIGEVIDQTWGNEAFCNLSSLACAAILEDGLHATHLRAGLELAGLPGEPGRRGHGPWAHRALEEELGPWLAGLGDPLAERLELRGQRLGYADGILRRVLCSPTGQHIVSTTGQGHVTLWDRDLPAHGRDLPRHGRDTFAAAFSPDGRLLLTGDMSGDLRLWDVLRDEQQAAWTWTSQVNAVAFVDRGQALTADFEGNLVVWDLRRQEPLTTITAHSRSASCLAVSADAAWALTGSSDETVALWDLAQAELVWRRELGTSVNEVALLPRDGDEPPLAAVAGYDGRLRLLDLADGDERRVIEAVDPGERGQSFYGLAVSPDGRRLAVVDAGWWVRLFDRGGAHLRSWRTHSTPLAIGFSSDGAGVMGGLRGGAIRWYPVATT